MDVRANMRAQEVMSIVLQFVNSSLASEGLKPQSFDFRTLQGYSAEDLSNALSQVKEAAKCLTQQKSEGLPPLLRDDAREVISKECGIVRVSADGKSVKTVNAAFTIEAAHVVETHENINETLDKLSKAETILTEAVQKRQTASVASRHDATGPVATVQPA